MSGELGDRWRVALLVLASCGVRGPGWLTGDCLRDHVQTEIRLRAIAEKHNAPCLLDTDCVNVEPKVECQGANTIAIARAQLPDWQAEQEAFEASVCPFLSKACHVTGDGAPGEPRCTEGFCDNVW